MNLSVDRKSNLIACLVPVLLSLCLVAGAVYVSAVILPFKKAEAEARGGTFGRPQRGPALSLKESAERSKMDLNLTVLIFALTLTIPAVILAFLFFRPGELPVLRTMPDSVAKSWGYDQTKTINPFGLTLLERKCLLSIVVSILLSPGIVVWSIWYLSIS
jgi:hypothetical protein